jgi:AcrR family transcriptional regulator
MSVAERPNHSPVAGVRSIGERLTEALAVLSHSPGPYDRATVAELCRRAGVSRNTLYRYHPNVLEALRRLQKQQGAVPEEAGADCRALRLELKSLQGQVAKLAALVDHFYGAYRECQVLLERRDREIAELRRSIKSPIQLRR